MGRRPTRRRVATTAPRAETVLQELLQRVIEAGASLEDVARRAGIARDEPVSAEGLLGSRLTDAQFTSLCRECVAVIEQHASRGSGHGPMTKAEVDMLCYCVVSCRDLRAVIGRAADFCRMLGGRAGELGLRVRGGQAHFTMHTFRRRDAFAFVSDITGLRYYHRLFSWLIGQSVEILALDASYPREMERFAAAALAPHVINFDAEVCGFRFDAKYLDRPVVRAAADLDRLLLEAFPFDFTSPVAPDLPLAERIVAVFDAALATGAALPDATWLADHFGFSQATLKRHLEREDVSLRELKDRCRFKVARTLLSDQRLSVAEVSERLGFTDSPTFRRAFHRWSGQSPAAWRRANRVPTVL